MRATTFVFVWVMSMAVPAVAQDWTEYQNSPDGFKVAFPGQPRMTETTWNSEYRYVLPAHVYSVEKGKERYSMTVVDYAPIEQQGIERRKHCPPGAEPCIGSDLAGPGHWKHDVRGAIVHAAFTFLQRNVTVTNFLWGHQDLVEGFELQLTNNADQSRTFAFIAMHEMKLYILEGTVPKGYPQPGLFQQSMGFVDKDGNGIRYPVIYSNEIYGMKQETMQRPAGRGGRRGGGAANTQQP